MDKTTAKRLLNLYLKVGDPLNEAILIIGTLPDVEEQKQLRRSIGELISTVYIDMIRPIVREYPDLDPDRSA